MKKTYDKILEILSIAFLCVSTFPLFMFGKLKDIPVPQHYTNGEVDVWGTRNVFIYLFLITALLYALLSVRTAVTPKVSRWLKLWVMVWFAFLAVSTYLIAIGNQSSMSVAVRWGILGCALVHLFLTLLFQR